MLPVIDNRTSETSDVNENTRGGEARRGEARGGEIRGERLARAFSNVVQKRKRFKKHARNCPPDRGAGNEVENRVSSSPISQSRLAEAGVARSASSSVSRKPTMTRYTIEFTGGSCREYSIAFRGNEDGGGAKGAAAKFPAFTRLTFDSSPLEIRTHYCAPFSVLRIAHTDFTIVFGEASSIYLDFFFFFFEARFLVFLDYSRTIRCNSFAKLFASEVKSKMDRFKIRNFSKFREILLFLKARDDLLFVTDCYDLDDLFEDERRESVFFFSFERVHQSSGIWGKLME